MIDLKEKYLHKIELLQSVITRSYKKIASLRIKIDNLKLGEKEKYNQKIRDFVENQKPAIPFDPFLQIFFKASARCTESEFHCFMEEAQWVKQKDYAKTCPRFRDHDGKYMMPYALRSPIKYSDKPQFGVVPNQAKYKYYKAHRKIRDYLNKNYIDWWKENENSADR